MDDLKPDRTKAALVIGAIAAILPFLIHMSSSSTTTVNGVVTDASYRDNFALAGGVVAILAGLIAIAVANKATQKPQLVGGLAVAALGIYQILRGLGKA